MTTARSAFSIPSPLRARWAALGAREKIALAAAAAVAAVALLWWLAVAPALATLRQSAQQHRSLDQRLQQVQLLQAQAAQLLAQPRTSREEALRALQALVGQQLGAAAKVDVAGERATVTLKGVPADALAQWLVQVRSDARTVPLEARLVRSAPPAAGKGSDSAAVPDVRWDGAVVLGLPPAR